MRVMGKNNGLQSPQGGDGGGGGGRGVIGERTDGEEEANRSSRAV